ncbi:MAG: GNAT family N-acetyltransferase [Clostridia bacterium]|nr:GNAT family N-acetyltransferase [Clostridia bacterium]
MGRVKKLVGEKVYLSPVETSDAEIFVNWMNDFGVTDYTMRSDKVVTMQSEYQWVNNEAQNDGYFMTIVRNDTDEMIGNISLNDVNFVHRFAVLGIMIGNNENRSKGYGAEAINLLLDYAFNYLNLNSVSLGVLACNERAIRCYEKVGFKEYGRKRMCRYINGKYYDVIYMDILASEFKGEYIKNKNV